MKIIDFDVTGIEHGESYDTVYISIMYDVGDNKDIVLNFAKNGDLIAYHRED